MNSHLYLLYFGLILFFAKTGGMLAQRFGQPEVLGQLLVGLLAGLFVKPLDIMDSFAEIGVILLMFVAGLETDVKELRRAGASSSVVAIIGVIAPVILVFIGVYLFEANFKMALALGVISAATSVSISVQTLREINKLKTPEGVTILGAAIIDDVIGIVLLTMMIGFLNPADSKGILGVGLVLLKVAIFALAVVVIGKLIKGLFRRFGKELSHRDMGITLSLVLCLLMAFFSEILGVAAVTGAYFAGVILSMTGEEHRISYAVNNMAGLIFIPIFFVYTGMGVDLTSAVGALALGLIITVMGILGKVVGCGAGAHFMGSPWRESLQVGIGMVPRAEVAIIVANLTHKMGFITADGLSACILMVLFTSMITPYFLKKSFEERKTTQA